MYTPNNTPVYLKAFAGFMGGITAVAVTGTEPRDFAGYAQMADAFAQAVDTAWGKRKATGLELDEILVVSEGVWENRSPLPAPDATDPEAYLTIAESVVARARQGNAQVVSEGINPNGGVTPPAPGTSLPNVLTLQPGGEAHAPNQFTDWDSLYAEFLITKGPVLIAFDITFVPSGIIELPLATFDMQGRAKWTATGLNTQIGGAQVAIPDGGIVKNLLGMDGTWGTLQLNTASTTVSPLQYDGSPFCCNFTAANGAAFEQRGAAPVFAVAPNQTLFLTLDTGINVNSFNSFGELVDLTAATSVLALEVYGGFNFFNASGKLIKGVAGSNLFYLYDASWPGNPANPNFLGTTNAPAVIDGSPFVKYGPAVPANWPVTVPTQVAQALDLLAARGSGNVPPFSSWLWVDQAAPAGGNGSVSAPFNTIAAANAAFLAKGPPSRANKYAIVLVPGIYPENVFVCPWIFIVGLDPFATRLTGTVSLFTDPGNADNVWNPPDNADGDLTDMRGALVNVLLTNPFTCDFNVGPTPGSSHNGSNEGKFYLENCLFNSLFTMIGFSGISQGQARHTTFSAGFTITGANFQTEESNGTGGGGGPITVQDNGSNLRGILSCFGGATNGPVNVTSTAQPATMVVRAFSIQGAVLTLTGAQASYTAGPEGIPPVGSVVLAGGAPAPVLSNDATALGFTPTVPANWPSPPPARVQEALDDLAARPSSASTSLIYRPGGPASGNIFSDPWLCWLAAFTAGVPVTIYVDCSIQSPAPWPVDSFMVNMTMAQSPIVAAPAVLGLVAGTNPFTLGPSNGALIFVDGLDGVGVVNVSSVPAFTMVQCGEIFGQSFFMRNGAFIQRADDASALALGIITDGTFELEIDNCQNPFPNLADPTAANVQFTNAAGTLTALVSRAGPDLHLPSFEGPAGATLNLRYDDTVSTSQLGQPDWAGTVNLIPLAAVGTSGYVIFRPGTPSAGNVVSTPAEVSVAAANGAATLYVDSSLAPAALPAGYTLPLFPGGIIGFRGLGGGFPDADLLTVDDTASLGSNVFFETIKITCACLTTPAFNFNPAATPLLVRGLSTFFALGPGATVPAYKVPNGQTFEVATTTLCLVAGVAGVPFFGASAGATLAGFAAFSSRWQATAMEGDAGSTVVFSYDPTCAPLAAFAGIVQYQHPGDIGSLTYDVGTANPATRPGGTPLSVGQPFYRTDLTIPVWFDGTQWRDATGTVVP